MSFAGWALATFCPQNVPAQERRSQLMWFIIGVTGFISPVLLWLFQKRLVLPEDEQPTKADEDEGEGEIRQTRRLRDATDATESPQKLSEEGTVLVIGRPVEGEL